MASPAICKLKIQKTGIFFIGLAAYWYKSYFHFAAELICNTGI